MGGTIMREELQEELFARFSFFRRKESLMESLMGFGFECGDGWYGIIKDLSEKIELELARPETLELMKTRKAAMIEAGYPEKEATRNSTFEVIQVKEKFGGLRYYTNWSTDRIDNLVAEAELKSLETCEVCGSRGTRRSGGWIVTLCDAHAKGKPEIEVEKEV